MRVPAGTSWPVARCGSQRIADALAAYLKSLGGEIETGRRVASLDELPRARAVLLDPNDTVVLLLDHQTGLFQTVKDVPIRDLRANAVALAKIAQQAGMPIIYTASEPGGSNGPIMEELAAAAPGAKYVARKGEVSAWDNADFVKAVEATGRKTLIMAGVWSSVCVAFPALSTTWTPRVSTPRESGVTSSNRTSFSSPPRTPACTAAPTATTSSGLTPL